MLCRILRYTYIEIGGGCSISHERDMQNSFPKPAIEQGPSLACYASSLGVVWAWTRKRKVLRARSLLCVTILLALP